MFYSSQILARKGPLGLMWMAAHMDRGLKRNQVAEASIPCTVDALLSPEAPLALRLSGQLLLGVCRVHARKVSYLLQVGGGAEAGMEGEVEVGVEVGGAGPAAGGSPGIAPAVTPGAPEEDAAAGPARAGSVGPGLAAGAAAGDNSPGSAPGAGNASPRGEAVAAGEQAQPEAAPAATADPAKNPARRQTRAAAAAAARAAAPLPSPQRAPAHAAAAEEAERGPRALATVRPRAAAAAAAGRLARGGSQRAVTVDEEGPTTIPTGVMRQWLQDRSELTHPAWPHAAHGLPAPAYDPAGCRASKRQRTAADAAGMGCGAARLAVAAVGPLWGGPHLAAGSAALGGGGPLAGSRWPRAHAAPRLEGGRSPAPRAAAAEAAGGAAAFASGALAGLFRVATGQAAPVDVLEAGRATARAGGPRASGRGTPAAQIGGNCGTTTVAAAADAQASPAGEALHAVGGRMTAAAPASLAGGRSDEGGPGSSCGGRSRLSGGDALGGGGSEWGPGGEAEDEGAAPGGEQGLASADARPQTSLQHQQQSPRGAGAAGVADGPCWPLPGPAAAPGEGLGAAGGVADGEAAGAEVADMDMDDNLGADRHERGPILGLGSSPAAGNDVDERAGASPVAGPLAVLAELPPANLHARSAAAGATALAAADGAAAAAASPLGPHETAGDGAGQQQPLSHQEWHPAAPLPYDSAAHGLDGAEGWQGEGLEQGGGAPLAAADDLEQPPLLGGTPPAGPGCALGTAASPPAGSMGPLHGAGPNTAPHPSVSGPRSGPQASLPGTPPAPEPGLEADSLHLPPSGPGELGSLPGPTPGSGAALARLRSASESGSGEAGALQLRAGDGSVGGLQPRTLRALHAVAGLQRAAVGGGAPAGGGSVTDGTWVDGSGRGGGEGDRGCPPGSAPAAAPACGSQLPAALLLAAAAHTQLPTQPGGWGMGEAAAAVAHGQGLQQHEGGLAEVAALTGGLCRRDAARCFYDLLVLHNRGLCTLQSQPVALGPGTSYGGASQPCMDVAYQQGAGAMEAGREAGAPHGALEAGDGSAPAAAAPPALRVAADAVPDLWVGLTRRGAELLLS
ncbi:Sister chromatid cohesion 1 protein 3 [Tetrabaena socialis]|uniref:Sister chromatid cohesion 1 protein 3 n=1 Tax=Tetrabaena socialis TaxID=47790 RepID=A0A2J8AIN6_9CHLO|nr:Sister chromatid cohesion 1 protein 3 [Tetrabaena socialis]|eukprot:PNH12380.1 Sister chromatid cohesion 1 protein 3 [Tetrabaena socialis]